MVASLATTVLTQFLDIGGTGFAYRRFGTPAGTLVFTQHFMGNLDNFEADEQAGLRSFAAGVRNDQQAVINGLTLHWNSGKVEGTVNKIKMIKRQMYGRAGFDLLRKSVILHPA
jgi:hypothetical protein